MIPYEDLVVALARWRQRQGLQAGPSDYLGEPAPASYDYAPAAAAPSDEVLDVSDEMMDHLMEDQSRPGFNPQEVQTSEYDQSYQTESDTQDEPYVEPSPTVDSGRVGRSDTETDSRGGGGRGKRRK